MSSNELERVVVEMGAQIAELKKALQAKEDPNLIKIATAAHLTDTSVTYIRTLMRAGKIKRYGEGRMVRVSKEELFAFLVQSRATVDARRESIEERAARLARGEK